MKVNNDKPYVDGWQVFQNSEGNWVTFPRYKLGSLRQQGIPESNCAGYARRVSAEIFGRDYLAPHPELRHAWNLPFYFASQRVERFKKLRELAQEKTLQPGHPVAFYNPFSTLNGIQRDMHGASVDYTHVATFMGEDTDNYLRFGQQIVQDRTLLTDREMKNSGFVPRRIIFDVPLKSCK